MQRHSASVAVQAAQELYGSVSVKAVGITNQRETTLVWRKSTGRPCHNAIVWHDARTRALCHELTERLGREHFQAKTGLLLSTYFSALKVKWMYDNVPEVKDAMDSGDAAIGTVDSWLIYNLTGGCDGGVHVTDVSNASRTLLMDVRTLQWCEECMAEFGIAVDALPRICSNSEVFGHMAKGPLQGVPIAGCLGDQQAALLGHGCVKGQAKNTYGTGCFLLVHTGTEPVESDAGLLTTVAYQLGTDAAVTYALEGSIATAGLAVAWLRDNLGLIKTAAESEELAGAVDDTGGVYFVPAFGGLLAPHWRDDARGTIVGLTQFSDKRHIVRAVLEAIAFQTRDVLGAVCADSGLQIEKLMVDGGATGNDLLMQIQADIAQVPVERPTFRETTSLGAAYAAGLAVGFYTQEQVFSREPAALKVFQPQADAAVVDERYAAWQTAVARSLGLADLA